MGGGLVHSGQAGLPVDATAFEMPSGSTVGWWAPEGRSSAGGSTALRPGGNKWGKKPHRFQPIST